jgi:N6-L-threonylcarbamoyladenine synthase
MEGHGQFELLGRTRDDAAGEAFDKVAVMLGLGYPGGPAIDRLSEEGHPAAIPFSRSTAKDGLDFSFSGLKTAVYHYVQKQTQGIAECGLRNADCSIRNPKSEIRNVLDRQEIADIAASFQEAAVDILITKTWRACQRTGIRRLVVGGGVAANRRLRERLAQGAASHGLQLVIPPPQSCVDNGAMVAGLAFVLLRQGKRSPLSLNADPNLHLA